MQDGTTALQPKSKDTDLTSESIKGACYRSAYELSKKESLMKSDLQQLAFLNGYQGPPDIESVINFIEVETKRSVIKREDNTYFLEEKVPYVSPDQEVIRHVFLEE